MPCPGECVAQCPGPPSVQRCSAEPLAHGRRKHGDLNVVAHFVRLERRQVVSTELLQFHDEYSLGRCS